MTPTCSRDFIGRGGVARDTPPGTLVVISHGAKEACLAGGGPGWSPRMEQLLGTVQLVGLASTAYFKERDWVSAGGWWWPTSVLELA